MDLKSAQGVITPAPGKSFDPTKIPKAVKEAGFTAGEIQVTAVGTFTSKEASLRLEMPGPAPEFVLAGGTKAKELEGRRDLVGQRLRVTGKLHPSHADKPPGLTVDTWAVVGKP